MDAPINIASRVAGHEQLVNTGIMIVTLISRFSHGPTGTAQMFRCILGVIGV